jgi:hypothetical protein
MSTTPEFLERWKRPASVAEVGGFRPPEGLLHSWAGRVRVGAPGETWPTTDGEPMLALAQLNLTEAPALPEALAGFAMLTLFIGPRELPVDEPNGRHWELRAYPALEELVPLEAPPAARERDPKARRGEATTYAALPIRWRRVEDFPARDELPPDLLDEYDRWEDELDDDMPRPADGLKLGGWPVCVQGEVSWHGHDGVDFVLQVDGNDNRIGFEVGYGGVFYVGHRASDGTWHADWQSL